MVNFIGVKELRANLNKYTQQVRRGKSFIVMKHNKPLFKMCPVPADEEDGEWETVIDFTKINPTGVPIEEIMKRLKRG